MGTSLPNLKKRNCALPAGCKNLIDVLKSTPPKPPLASTFRVNGRIRAREVRVVGEQGERLGIMRLGDAIQLATSCGIDLVEIEPEAKPPICRLVDYGKFRYELSKRRKSKS